MTTAISQWLQGFFRGVRERTDARAAFGGDRNEPVEVYAAANAMEAEVIRALLESEGIPAYIGGTALSDVYGIQVGPLAEVKVFVVKALAPRAIQIIDERNREFEPEEGWEKGEWWDEEEEEG